MRILVTGGAGYIGSHVALDLLVAGHDVVVIDNFVSGHPEAVRRIQELSGRDCALVRADIADEGAMRRALEGIDVVIHLAAYKGVGDSMARPERYYRNNVGGMAVLLSAMVDAGVTRIVYSSSASVYGTPATMPIAEDAPLLPESPYGLSKKQGEEMVEWMVRRREWAGISLRYFNPVGAHSSGRIGQPWDEDAALVPRALRALTDPSTPLTIFGDDWPTPDGTCLRDYVHIGDLSRAHLVAIDLLASGKHDIFNVGTGRPHSVREVLDACRRAAGRDVPARDGMRRPGDPACSTADVTRFRERAGFVAEFGLDAMIGSAWRWWRDNPRGYAS